MFGHWLIGSYWSFLDQYVHAKGFVVQFTAGRTVCLSKSCIWISHSSEKMWIPFSLWLQLSTFDRFINFSLFDASFSINNYCIDVVACYVFLTLDLHFLAITSFRHIVTGGCSVALLSWCLPFYRLHLIWAVGNNNSLSIGWATTFCFHIKCSWPYLFRLTFFLSLVMQHFINYWTLWGFEIRFGEEHGFVCNILLYGSR